MPSYRTLWWGGLFSLMSVQMQFLLRGLLAWDLTEREGALGLTYLCFGVALLIATPIGGVATDRLSKRTIILVSQAVLMTAAVVMGVLIMAGLVQFWMLLVAAVLQGLAFAFFGPARVALASEYVGRDQLGNAIALTMLSMNGTRIFAPSLAGILAGVALFGLGGVYLISGFISSVSFVLLLRLPPSESAPSTGRNPFREIADGVTYVFRRPPLRRLIISSFFVIMFGFNYIAFYPAMVEGVFGLDEAWVGYISSASAIGAVVVSIPLAGHADSPRAKSAMVIGGLLFGLGVIGFGLSPSFWVAAGVIVIVGAATTVFQSLSNTLALALTDDSHQGRVQSLMMLSFAGFGIAAAPLGLLAEWIGLRSAIVIMGSVATVAVAAYAMFDRNAAVIDSSPDTEPQDGGGGDTARPAPTNAGPGVSPSFSR